MKNEISIIATKQHDPETTEETRIELTVYGHLLEFVWDQDPLVVKLKNFDFRDSWNRVKVVAKTNIPDVNAGDPGAESLHFPGDILYGDSGAEDGMKIVRGYEFKGGKSLNKYANEIAQELAEKHKDKWKKKPKKPEQGNLF